MHKTTSRFVRLCAMVGLAILSLGTAAAQEVPHTLAAAFTVNSTSDVTDVNPGNGICETAAGNGVCTLRAAIMETNALVGDDTITLPAGTFMITRLGSDDTGINGDFDIRDNLTIVGTGLLTTFIDGNRSVTGERVFHLVDLPNNVTLTLTGVTVKNGVGGIFNDRNTLNLNYTGVFDNNNTAIGGGIRNQVGTVNVFSSLIGGNTSNNSGGGIYNDGGTLSLVNAEINGNQANGSGGGINNNGTLTMIDATIIDNHTIGNTGGGGVNNCSSCTAIILGSSLSNNTAATGAAIYNSGGPVTIGTSTLDNNVGSNGSGGLFNNGGVVTIINSTIYNNQASAINGGGIDNTGSGTITLIGSTVNANEAAVRGGGIENTGGSVMTLVNTTVSGNYALIDGGGIYNFGSSIMTLRNATIASNNANSDGVGSGNGGGIYNGSGTVNFRNTIIGLNRRGLFGGTADDCYGSITSQGYNLVQTLTDCMILNDDNTNLKNVNPLLGALAANGGPTQTRALQTGSPAINTANPAGCTDQNGATLTGDQRSAARFGTCDMGAYEYQGCMLTGDLNDDRAVTAADIVLAANHWNAPPASYHAASDLNGNGSNDIPDIMLVAAQFGQPCP